MLNRRPVNRRKSEGTRLQWLHGLGWRRWSLLVGSGAAVIGATFTLLWLVNRPIEYITVEGSFQRVSAAELEKLARQHIVGAGLVSVNLGAVRASLRQLPWIDDVAVQRSWPRGLRLRVVEQVAIARWNSTELVNVRGELFRSDERFIPAGLPQLSGPEGTEAEVIARYFATQGHIVEAGAHLLAVQVDARGAWRLTLDNGVEVRLGRTQVDERYQRFLDAALPLLAARAAEIAYVDMRYSNGYAIGWRAHAPRLARLTESEGLHPNA
jgi:cell division protein FtsQ